MPGNLRSNPQYLAALAIATRSRSARRAARRSAAVPAPEARVRVRLIADRAIQRGPLPGLGLGRKQRQQRRRDRKARRIA